MKDEVTYKKVPGFADPIIHITLTHDLDGEIKTETRPARAWAAHRLCSITPTAIRDRVATGKHSLFDCVFRPGMLAPRAKETRVKKKKRPDTYSDLRQVSSMRWV